MSALCRVDAALERNGGTSKRDNYHPLSLTLNARGGTLDQIEDLVVRCVSVQVCCVVPTVSEVYRENTDIITQTCVHARERGHFCLVDNVTQNWHVCRWLLDRRAVECAVGTPRTMNGGAHKCTRAYFNQLPTLLLPLMLRA